MTEIKIIRTEPKRLRTDEEKRKAKGYELFLKGKVKYVDLTDYWKFEVRCSTDTDKGAYDVDLVEQTCTCPDNQYRLKQCKHIFAAHYARHEAGYPLLFSATHNKMVYEKVDLEGSEFTP